MTIDTRQVLRILYIISWIIFVGLCIEAARVIAGTGATLLLNADMASRFWQAADLSSLYQHDHGHFLAQSILIGIVAVLKACMFYSIIKILHGRKLDMAQPFRKEVARFIAMLSYMAFAIGFFSSWGARYAGWLATKGIIMPDLEQMHIGGADVWLFMGVIIFIIAQMFKRGIEIQQENELTV